MPSPTIATAASTAISTPRRLFHPKRHTATASADPGHSGIELLRATAPSVCAPIVNVVVTALPAGVTVAGLNEHEAPAGSPLQANETAALNPLSGVTVSVTVPCPPELIVSEPGEAPSVNVGGGAEVTVSNTVADSVVLPLVPLTVTEELPVGVLKADEMVITAVPVPVIVVGSKLAVAPLGKFAAVSATGELKPPATVTLITAVALVPAGVLTDASG